MNPVALFLMLILNSNGTCLAQGDHTMSITGEPYLMQTYQCFWGGSEVTPSHTFEVWSPICPDYVDKPVAIKELQRHKGWTMNEFGQFYPATIDIDRMEVYRPPCQAMVSTRTPREK
jgi:hypothetical protein